MVLELEEERRSTTLIMEFGVYWNVLVWHQTKVEADFRISVGISEKRR